MYCNVAFGLENGLLELMLDTRSTQRICRDAAYLNLLKCSLSSWIYWVGRKATADAESWLVVPSLWNVTHQQWGSENNKSNEAHWHQNIHSCLQNALNINMQGNPIEGWCFFFFRDSSKFIHYFLEWAMAEMQNLSLTLAHLCSFHLRSAFSGGLRTPDSSQLELFQFTRTITASYLLMAFSFRCLRLI